MILLIRQQKNVFLVSSDTSATEIYSGNPQISSKNALNGNRNYQVVDFVLPANTISWSFYIGTGSEGEKEYKRAFTDFATSATSAIPGYGPMAALALNGASYFDKVQGEDNVKYRFISNVENVNKFYAGESYMQYKMGDVINEASRMVTPTSGKVYLALINDNTAEPIVVTIHITAIKVLNNWDTRTIQVMSVNPREVPYLHN